MAQTGPIEELNSIKVVGGEAGAGSSCPINDGRFEMLVEAKGLPDRPAKIQKVIFMLRGHQEFANHFEPRVASLGPIHHGNPKYKLGEMYKLRLANEFVKGCHNKEDISNKDVYSLFQKIKEDIKELRDCFEEEVTKCYNDDDLTWLLLVDGCATLQYIYCDVESKFSELNIKTDSVAFARQDLFLLENQVPFRLLKFLLEKKWTDSIERFIQIEIGEVNHGKGSPSQQKEPTHLLDLLRTRLLGDPKPSTPPTKVPEKKKRDQDWQSFRTVQELKAAGIKVRGRDCNLGNIKFTGGFGFYPGCLELPRLTVDDCTGPKFRNLIAYEMCLDFHNDFGISCYISFLDSLIDEANDVKVLRKAHVLRNFLGSDKEVAKLFNEIGTDVVLSGDMYQQIKRQIQENCDSNWQTWLAEFRHNYFSTPWTVIAFTGALLALALTATQTWYQVKCAQPPAAAAPP